MESKKQNKRPNSQKRDQITGYKKQEEDIGGGGHLEEGGQKTETSSYKINK